MGKTLADPAWRERISREAAGFGIDRAAGMQRFGQRRGGKRLDADDLDAAAIPSGDPRDQAASADRHQQRVDIRGLLIELHANAALSQDGFVLVKGMNRHGAALAHPCFAGGERVGIAVTFDDQIGAVLADALDLGCRRHAWNEDLGRPLQLHRGVSDRGAVVAARCGNHAARGHVASEQICKGAARLERSRALKKFELETKPARSETEVAGVNLTDWRAPDIRPYVISRRAICCGVMTSDTWNRG